jgi:glutathione S-transferase
MHRPVTLDHTCQCSAVPEVKLWRRIRPITTHDRYGCRRVHVPRKIGRAAMKLYDLKTGTNTRRVRIFLAEKGVKLPTVEVDMMKGENKSPDYLAKNPMGTMPLLELDDGTQIAESVAICRYIEELHPEPPLFGTTPIERALIEMWNRRMELELLIPIIDNFVHSSAFYKERLSQVADIAQRGRMHAQARMRWLDSELAQRPFITGDRYTIADITVQCALILGKNTGTPIPNDSHHLARWFSDVSKRPTARA